MELKNTQSFVDTVNHIQRASQSLSLCRDTHKEEMSFMQEAVFSTVFKLLSLAMETLFTVDR